MKKFPQKESSRISLDPLIQKNWCLWYDWQLSWWLSCRIRQNDWQHRRSCRTWSAVRTTKLCILIYVAPPSVVHFNHVAAEKLLLMCAKNCQIWLRRFKNKSKTVRWSRFFGPRCDAVHYAVELWCIARLSLSTLWWCNGDSQWRIQRGKNFCIRPWWQWRCTLWCWLSSVCCHVNLFVYNVCVRAFVTVDNGSYFVTHISQLTFDLWPTNS